MKDIVWMILHYIGSAMPLAVLCFMIVFILKGHKIKNKTVVSYIVVAILMFFILLRT
jgi:hypothetical protein